jgi:hypothetical protein
MAVSYTASDLVEVKPNRAFLSNHQRHAKRPDQPMRHHTQSLRCDGNRQTLPIMLNDSVLGFVSIEQKMPSLMPVGANLLRARISRRSRRQRAVGASGSRIRRVRCALESARAQ